MERYIEAIFRHKLLFFCLLVLVPAAGVVYAFKNESRLYQSTATVWAEKPPYLSTIGDWNQWISAAQNQQSNVQEFLQTDSFDVAVLSQTDLRGYLSNPLVRQQLILDIRRYATVTTSGQNLVTISFSSPNARVSSQVVKAIIEQFNKDILAQSSAQGSAALAFYEQQLAQANKRLADATATLRSYFEAHPALINTSLDKADTLLSNAAFTAQYPEVIKLIQARDTADKEQQSLQSQVNQIKFSESSNAIGQGQAFRIMDEPNIPLHPVVQRRELIIPIALSAAASITLAGIALVAFAFFDHAIYSASVAAQELQLPVFGTLPYVPARRRLFPRRRIVRRDIRTVLSMEVAASSRQLPPPAAL
ncbi:MAG: hypothetical protein M1296_06470 [Chloroflexi bacterium]|nr:hypothetical protein [Chloroflexota bacterium]